jgi:hypothetical protein
MRGNLIAKTYLHRQPRMAKIARSKANLWAAALATDKTCIFAGYDYGRRFMDSANRNVATGSSP